MSLLAALLLAQVPPPPSGMALPPGAIEIPAPIFGAVSRYDSCLRRAILAEGELGEDREGYRDRLEGALAACAPTRAGAVEEADRRLERAPGFGDPEKRDLALRHAFEGTDHKWRTLPETMDRNRRMAQAHAESLPAIDVPREMLSAFGTYFGCVTSQYSTLHRNGYGAPDIRARALAACREVRAVQLERSVQLLASSRKRGDSGARDLAGRTFDGFDSDYPIERTVFPPIDLLRPARDEEEQE